MANLLTNPCSEATFAARKKASDEKVALAMKMLLETTKKSTWETPVGPQLNHSEWPLPSTPARPSGSENGKPKAWGKGRVMTPSLVSESPAAKIQNITEAEAMEAVDTAAIINLQNKFQDCSTAGSVEEESMGIRVTSIEFVEESIRVTPKDNMEKELRERRQQAANLQYISDFNTVRDRSEQLIIEHICTPKSQAWSSLSPGGQRAFRAQAPSFLFFQLYKQDDRLKLAICDYVVEVSNCSIKLVPMECNSKVSE